MKNKSQCAEILNYLKHNRRAGITPLEALNLCGCWRLGARIYDLKELGYNIETKMIKTHPAFFNNKRYACYFLKNKKSS